MTRAERIRQRLAPRPLQSVWTKSHRREGAIDTAERCRVCRRPIIDNVQVKVEPAGLVHYGCFMARALGPKRLGVA